MTIPGEDQRARSAESTVDDIVHPAYMLSYAFELTWSNDAARTVIPGLHALGAGSAAPNIFSLIRSAYGQQFAEAHRELVSLYAHLAKPRISREALQTMAGQLHADAAAYAEHAYDAARVSESNDLADFRCTLHGADGAPHAWRVFGVYFREGILIVHVPEGASGPDVPEFVSRRDVVVRSLVRQQSRCPTPSTVLSVTVGPGARLRSELPVEIYFALVQDAWRSVAPLVRKHRGSDGHQLGDGMQYRFVERPDARPGASARACAEEMRQTIRQIDARWRLQLPWLPELEFAVELKEQESWIGTEAGSSFAAEAAQPSATGARERAYGQTLRDIKALGEKLMALERARSLARRFAA